MNEIINTERTLEEVLIIEPLIEKEKPEVKTYKKVEISEFFERNKHILGFDNPSKAIMTCLKEFCDNSLDACEDEGILPELTIEIKKKKDSSNLYRVSFTDNGPGIPLNMVPKVFGKLLFGSKFHENKQKRGQQGIGASAVVLYSQITTGSPMTIHNRLGNGYEDTIVLGIDVKKNEPKIYTKKHAKSNLPRGVTVEVELEATFFKLGPKAVTHYLSLINTINPYTKITLIDPENIKTIWNRTTEILRKPPRSYKYSIKNLDIGLLRRYLLDSEKLTIIEALNFVFESMDQALSEKTCRLANIQNNTPLELMSNYEFLALKKVVDTLVIPEVTEENFSICGQELESHLSKMYKSKEVDFLEYHKSKINHYNGSSFVVETVLCYGGTLAKDKKMEVIRVGNKVPFLFQGGACALQKTISSFNWKTVGFSQNENELPIAPAIVYVHLVSTKIPFISESKEAVSEVPEIVESIRECLIKTSKSLLRHIEFQQLAKKREQKKEIVEKFFPLLVEKVCKILNKEVKKYPEILNKINEGIIIKKNSSHSFVIENLYNTKKQITLEYGTKTYVLSLEKDSITYFNPENIIGQILFKKLKIKNQSKALKIYIESI